MGNPPLRPAAKPSAATCCGTLRVWSKRRIFPTAQGFPSVLQVGLPALREGSEAGKSLNDAALVALLRLIQAVQDTNILTRSDPQTLQWAQQQAGEVLEQGAGPEQMRELDRAFTARNLSPGGCADLLALSLFLFFMGR